MVKGKDARPSISGADSSDEFDGNRRGFAAADAQAGDAPLLTVRLQGVDQGGQNTCARGADRMTECAGAAVDVDRGRIESEITGGGHGHHGESFVYFIQIHVGGAPVELPQQLLDRAHRGQG